MAFYLGLPVALALILSLRGAEITGFFGYIKFVLIIAATLFTIALRHKKWVERSRSRAIFYALILFNLVEAATFDIYDYLASTPEVPLGGSAINFAAWVIIILTLAYPNRLTVRTDDENEYLHYDLGMGWVVAYTICDYVFLFGSNAPGEPTGQWGGYTMIHLAVPLLLMGKNASLYMQMRVYSLCWSVFIPLAYPHPPLMFKTMDWYGPNIITILQWLSLGAALYLVWRSWTRVVAKGESPSNMLESLFKRLSPSPSGVGRSQ